MFYVGTGTLPAAMYQLYDNSGDFNPLGVSGTNVAVRSKTDLWRLQGELLYHYINGAWTQIPGNQAIDIAVASDGTSYGAVYYVGTPSGGSDNAIYKLLDDKGDFQSLPNCTYAECTGTYMTGLHVAVGPHGDPWVIKSNTRIYHFTNGSWTRVINDQAQQISVGPDGSVWYVGTGTLPAEVYQLYDDNPGNFKALGITGNLVAGAPGNTLYVLQNENILHGTH
jgi:hypothetical protein